MTDRLSALIKFDPDVIDALGVFMAETGANRTVAVNEIIRRHLAKPATTTKAKAPKPSTSEPVQAMAAKVKALDKSIQSITPRNAITPTKGASKNAREPIETFKRRVQVGKDALTGAPIYR